MTVFRRTKTTNFETLFETLGEACFNVAKISLLQGVLTDVLSGLILKTDKLCFEGRKHVAKRALTWHSICCKGY